MVGHGDGITLIYSRLRQYARDAKTAEVGEPEIVGDAKIPGFSHFLDDGQGVLPPCDRFKIGGVLPTFDPKSQEALQRLMGRLGHRMHTPYEETSNPCIPAGYTYLLQLVAHDLVQSSAPVALVSDPDSQLRNNRQYRLTLDTIYGAGPGINAFAYALDAETPSIRTKLRLGRMKSPNGQCPFRDIGRVRPENQTGVALEKGYSDVLIADARNDDNAILAQLVVLFHLFHNGMVAKLFPRARAPGASADEAAVRSFDCARSATTLIYRNIIRKDLMRRVLHPAIYSAYKGMTDPGELLHRPDARMPLEFSHAAFRFGHAMIRDKYVINNSPAGGTQQAQAIASAIRKTSARRPKEMPLNKTWIVKWSNFFNVNGRSPNLSQKIRPHYSRGLLIPEVFPAVGFTGRGGLAVRDLLSSAELGLWSVDRLIARLKDKCDDNILKAIEASPLTSDREYRSSSLTRWLSEHISDHGLNENDVGLLAKDPPLLFYIQFEAWKDFKDILKDTGEVCSVSIEGRHLGIVGSIIIAEVIFGALMDRLEYEAASKAGPPELRESLKNLSNAFFPGQDNVFADVPPLDDMDELVPYIAKLADLENAEPDFL